MDYNTTVNLPKTDFSMKGNLPSKEPGILEKWSALDVYGTLLKRDQDKPLFVLHDGPPYANGDIHLGHALNKSLKDFVVRYKSMRGFNTPFIPGWDTHGLPTELKVIKEKKIRKDTVGIVPYRKTCKEVAEKYHQIQSKSFERLGCRADYAHPYITFTGDYEAEQIRVFGEMALRGCVYRGLKPVFWCPDCGTALAEAEIEYAEDPCVTVFVKFPAVKVPDSLAALAEGKRLSFVIWTTTPWTLPGNLAISLNPSFEYAVVAVEGEAYVIAKELVEGVMKECGVEEYAVLGTVKGEELEYAVCRHPFLERDSLVIVGQHVTLEAGTGCVHTAPGFGMDDYIVCSKYPSLPIVVPVDDRGVQTAEAGQFAGLTYDKSNVAIVDYLRENGYLLGEKKIKHQYPHCWRCHKPILMRATRQWFVSVDKFKEAAIEAAGTATWYPRWGYDRIVKMIADRNDWCISRQRAWGVPIPMVICEECGEPIIDRKFFEAVASVFEKEDSNAWYERSAEEWMALAGLSACAHCGSTKFRKEQDIMDVWFDSGSSHTAVFAHRPECGSA
ncbi:MAG: isoleucine--tRNA ligase, partial [Clostridia bacterium]|nr:isoleucine--tRNA ligase [Clostridia bacterium]